MRKKYHIIWGNTPKTSRKISKLREKGKKSIYVLDQNQTSKVREKEGVIYISLEGMPFLIDQNQEFVMHYYIPKRPKRKNKSK